MIVWPTKKTGLEAPLKVKETGNSRAYMKESLNMLSAQMNICW
jgi:hypothetical protein